MKSIHTFALLTSLLGMASHTNAVAQAAPVAAASATEDLSDGEVKKVDKDAGKITLKHGELKNLDMPGMTMVFTVKDKALLNKVQQGDKVKFRAVSDSGKLVVTELRSAK